MVPLTSDPAPDWNPRWSPNGREIAFYAYRSGNRDIWVMPSSGGPARQITAHPAVDWYPVWSPDGQEIAFNAPRDGGGIWIVPASGAMRVVSPRAVTAQPGHPTASGSPFVEALTCTACR